MGGGGGREEREREGERVRREGGRNWGEGGGRKRESTWVGGELEATAFLKVVHCLSRESRSLSPLV